MSKTGKSGKRGKKEELSPSQRKNESGGLTGASWLEILGPGVWSCLQHSSRIGDLKVMECEDCYIPELASLDVPRVRVLNGSFEDKFGWLTGSGVLLGPQESG